MRHGARADWVASTARQEQVLIRGSLSGSLLTPETAPPAAGFHSGGVMSLPRATSCLPRTALLIRRSRVPVPVQCSGPGRRGKRGAPAEGRHEGPSGDDDDSVARDRWGSHRAGDVRAHRKGAWGLRTSVRSHAAAEQVSRPGYGPGGRGPLGSARSTGPEAAKTPSWGSARGRPSTS